MRRTESFQAKLLFILKTFYISLNSGVFSGSEIMIFRVWERQQIGSQVTKNQEETGGVWEDYLVLIAGPTALLEP